MSANHLSIVTNEKWKVELVPEDAVFYRRLHYTQIDRATKLPAANGFDQMTPDLSCDWNKYTTPQEMLERIGKERKLDGSFKNPAHFSICRLYVKDALALEDVLSAQHTPKQNDPEEIGNPNNRAHCDLECVIHLKNPNSAREKASVKARLLLAKISQLVMFDEEAWKKSFA